MQHTVFVYGTLRFGEPNHRLLAHAQYLGGFRTPPRYTMLDLGGYPGVIKRGRAAILGEVYRVDQQTLVQLDRLEEYPRVYDRELIRSPYGRTWIYVYRHPAPNQRAIPGGDWRRRHSAG